MLIIKTFIIFFFYCSVVFGWDGTDFKKEALSPFTTSAQNVLIVGGGLTLSVLLFEDAIVDPTQKGFVDDKPLGSFSKFGDIAGKMVPNVLYAFGQTWVGISGKRIGYNRALGMIKASAYAVSITTALKYTIREPRPNGSTKNSFPSGHATTAFAFAGYIYEDHGWTWGVPALAMATFVDASRINDNAHFLHDVLAGTTIGLAYGIGISKIDKIKRDQEEKKSNFTFLPLLDWKTKGIVIVGEF